MYPESFFWWLGGIAIVLGILGLVGMLAWYVDYRISSWQERKGRKMGTFEDDDL